ncbi:unnamed protein product [Brugia timori]|uniref:Secreted protein n=1 Tax=Brugia timori TaxID=42155 RepID=A0A0R3R7N0_9BILA|nr:unnamed protein product [Brugia timori]
MLSVFSKICLTEMSFIHYLIIMSVMNVSYWINMKLTVGLFTLRNDYFEGTDESCEHLKQLNSCKIHRSKGPKVCSIL